MNIKKEEVLPDFTIYNEIEAGNSTIEYYRNFLSCSESYDFYWNIIDNVVWEQKKISYYGKEYNIPRLQAWMGDIGVEYIYSKMKLVSIGWNEDVLEIRNRIQELTGHKFNSVLLNLYRDQNDSVSWHRDDEPELGYDPIIASVSLGFPRVFEMRSLDKPTKKLNIILEDGSLLIMGNGVQKKWEYRLPKMKQYASKRINLTFRYIEKG